MRFAKHVGLSCGLAAVVLGVACAAADAEVPSGFTAIFNGKDLSGWHGETTMDPAKWRAMPADELARKRAEDQADAVKHWRVDTSGELVNDGGGVYLTTDESYGDVELLVDWKIVPKADSGIYLRGTPQVQIWDFTDPSKAEAGGAKGSGGLWNNSPGRPGKDPLVLADKPQGEWNRFRILQVGDKTTIHLNDKLVVDAATMENYWNRKRPLEPRGPIQLQTHGGEMRWKNVFVREIPTEEANRLLRGTDPDGFVRLFNGKDLSGWAGAVDEYEIVDGAIACKPGKGGVLHTKEPYADFVVRLEFQLPPGGNNGLAIRYPGSGNAAYSGMCELQVLDDEHPQYAKLDARQYHGSAYGMAAAHRGYLRPAGEWNYQQVTVKGSTIKVELNGVTILDTDLVPMEEFMANSPHPGKDLEEGFFGFAGHGDQVKFRAIAIRKLGP
jgi:hypothetical protein